MGNRAYSSIGELLLGIVGGLVALALIGFLGYQAVALRDTPPRLEATVVDLDREPDGLVLRVRVDNRGGTAARGVRVAGYSDGAAATTTLDQVAPHSSGEVVLVLPGRPLPEGIRVRVLGYTPS